MFIDGYSLIKTEQIKEKLSCFHLENHPGKETFHVVLSTVVKRKPTAFPVLRTFR
jgi:hypothetical protein